MFIPMISLAGFAPANEPEPDFGSFSDPLLGGRIPQRYGIKSAPRLGATSAVLAWSLAVGFLSCVLGLVVVAIIGFYFAHLDAQARARLRPLPRSLCERWQPLYPNVDLRRVRYAEQIDTVHGQGITVGQRIYFPRRLNLARPADRHWMAHELQHCSQYGASGKVGSFLRVYFAQVARQVIAHRSFDVHDRLGLEIDAEKKAGRVAPV